MSRTMRLRIVAQEDAQEGEDRTGLKIATYHVEIDIDGDHVFIRQDGHSGITGSERLVLEWQDADARKDDREMYAPSVSVEVV